MAGTVTEPAPADPSPTGGDQEPPRSEDDGAVSRPADGGAAPQLSPRWRRMAESRYALFFVCLLSFADACISPILPEVLFVPLLLMYPRKRYVFAFWCALSSVIGGICGYGLGFLLWEHGLREFAFEYIPGFTPDMFENVSTWYGEGAFLWVWLGGFTPLPYKIFTVMAGVCHDDVSFPVFLVASILSRFPRIYLTVWLLDQLGPNVLDFLLRRFSRVLLVLLLVVLGAVLWVQFA